MPRHWPTLNAFSRYLKRLLNLRRWEKRSTIKLADYYRRIYIAGNVRVEVLYRYVVNIDERYIAVIDVIVCEEGDGNTNA